MMQRAAKVVLKPDHSVWFHIPLGEHGKVNQLSANMMRDGGLHHPVFWIAKDAVAYIVEEMIDIDQPVMGMTPPDRSKIVSLVPPTDKPA